MRAKICGITQEHDAKMIGALYPWAVGFNFYKHSLRYVTSAQAKSLTLAIPEKILRVGIFIDNNAYEIEKTMDELNLHFAQVYRDVPKLNRQKCILSLQASCESALPPLSVLKQYAYVLMDACTQNPNQYGGSGQLANWALAKKISREVPLILAGGLNPENVIAAIEQVNPFAVDVASGVEKRAGKKDLLLVKQFMKETYDV